MVGCTTSARAIAQHVVSKRIGFCCADEDAVSEEHLTRSAVGMMQISGYSSDYALSSCIVT